MKASRRIESVKVRRMVDDDPDTSWLGEYTDEFSEDYVDVASGEFIKDLPCERCARQRKDHFEGSERCEDWRPEVPERGREYRFFKPCSGGEKPGTPDYYTSGKQDFERMQGLNRGDWCFIGVRAEAEIVVNNVCQRITSGGLWGIQSDSERSYIDEVGQEELSQLREILRGLGFSKRTVDVALSKAETTDA